MSDHGFIQQTAMQLYAAMIAAEAVIDNMGDDYETAKETETQRNRRLAQWAKEAATHLAEAFGLPAEGQHEGRD